MSKIYRSKAAEPQPVSYFDFDESFTTDAPGEFMAAADQVGDESPAGNAPVDGESPQKVDMEAVREEAFMRGRQEGMAAAEAQLGSTTRTLAAAIEEISRLRKTLVANSTHDMVRLVMAITEQVIHATVEEKEETILQVLGNALQAAVQSDEFHVKVNPQDLVTVTAQQPLFLASISGLKNIVFEGDGSIARGGCLVESTLGEVDATIETQLEEVRHHLRQAVGQ